MKQRGIGDVLKALSATPRGQWDAVVETLGFTVASEDTGSRPASASTRSRGQVRPSPTPADSSQDQPSAQDESELPVRQPSSVRARGGEVPQWLDVLSLPAPNASAAKAPAPPYEPLFSPRQAPALLTAMCSTTRLSGDIDVGRAVDQVARRRPIRQLPRRPRPTLARGVRVVADAGEGLKPFRDDWQQLVAALNSLLGQSLVEDTWFFDDPLDVESPERSLRPGTPVLLLTDLGIGGNGARRRWPRPERLQAFTRQLAAIGSPVIALVPYAPDRWPAGMSRQLSLVCWDRRTTISDVRTARQVADAASS